MDNSNFNIETLLPNARDKIMEAHSPIRDDSPYRTCLMVADTSQGGELDQSPDKNKKQRRPRTCFSDEQLKELERRFRLNKYVSVADRTSLCSELGLNDTQIKTWFQNRRTKWKRLNEARCNLINDAITERVWRKEGNSAFTYSPASLSQSALSDQSPGGFSSLHQYAAPSLHSFPNYMYPWGSYNPLYNSGATSALTSHSSSGAMSTSLPHLTSTISPLASTTPLVSMAPHSPMVPAISSTQSGNTLEAFNHSTSLYPTKDSLYPLKDSLYPVKDNLYPSSKDNLYPGVKEDCYSSYYSPCVDQKQIPIRNNFHSSSALTN